MYLYPLAGLESLLQSSPEPIYNTDIHKVFPSKGNKCDYQSFAILPDFQLETKRVLQELLMVGTTASQITIHTLTCGQSIPVSTHVPHSPTLLYYTHRC